MKNKTNYLTVQKKKNVLNKNKKINPPIGVKQRHRSKRKNELGSSFVCFRIARWFGEFLAWSVRAIPQCKQNSLSVISLPQFEQIWRDIVVLLLKI